MPVLNVPNLNEGEISRLLYAKASIKQMEKYNNIQCL